MPTVVEQKFRRFAKEKQKVDELKAKKRTQPVGTCRKCRTNVTFLSNTLNGVRLIFCPNCKHINGTQKVTQEEVQSPTPVQPTVVIKGPGV